MAYTKNTWADGDIVTSEKLNHMEDGIASGESVFIVGGVTLDENGDLKGTLDKTWQEIHDAMQSKICIAVITSDRGIKQELITETAVIFDEYYVSIWGGTQFTTSTANGYPAGGGGGK